MADDRSEDGQDRRIGDQEIEVAARWLAMQVDQANRRSTWNWPSVDRLTRTYRRRLTQTVEEYPRNPHIELRGPYYPAPWVHVWPGNARGFIGTTGQPTFRWTMPDPDPILDPLLAALASDPADPDQRAVVSDALEERGRMGEAGLLRSEGVEIAVLGGRVFDTATMFGATERMRQRIFEGAYSDRVDTFRYALDYPSVRRMSASTFIRDL
jgi:uncharacterized protein (TIGR02996 family)